MIKIIYMDQEISSTVKEETSTIWPVCVCSWFSLNSVLFIRLEPHIISKPNSFRIFMDSIYSSKVQIVSYLPLKLFESKSFVSGMVFKIKRVIIFKVIILRNDLDPVILIPIFCCLLCYHSFIAIIDGLKNKSSLLRSHLHWMWESNNISGGSNSWTHDVLVIIFCRDFLKGNFIKNFKVVQMTRIVLMELLNEWDIHFWPLFEGKERRNQNTRLVSNW